MTPPRPSLRARALGLYLRRVVKPRIGALPAVNAQAVDASRRRLGALQRRVRAPAGVEVRAAPAQVPGEWLWPPSPAAPGHGLYLHGGAYAVGSARLYRGLAGRLAAATGCAVLVPDYPLAPEHPFPAALEGALQAWDALERAAAGPVRWLAGDSAGGGLALALAQRLCGAGRPPPQALALLSPWTDLRGSGDSVRANADTDHFLAAHLLASAAANYLQGADPWDPRASPLYGPMEGLPPVLLHACQGEILLDDSVRLAARLGAAGVPATLRRFGDLPHVFHLFAPLIPEAATAIDEVATFLRAGEPPR